MRNSLRGNCSGFSLVEILIASFILTFTGLALSKLQLVLSRNLQAIEQHSSDIHHLRKERERVAFLLTEVDECRINTGNRLLSLEQPAIICLNARQVSKSTAAKLNSRVEGRQFD